MSTAVKDECHQAPADHKRDHHAACLTPLLRDFQPPPLPVSFVYSPNRFMPVKLRAFLDFALPRLKTRLGDLPKGVAPRGRVKTP